VAENAPFVQRNLQAIDLKGLSGRYLPATKPARRASTNLHLNFPIENIDNRVRIIPVNRVDGS